MENEKRERMHLERPVRGVKSGGMHSKCGCGTVIDRDECLHVLDSYGTQLVYKRGADGPEGTIEVLEHVRALIDERIALIKRTNT
jgi:hypothetical protein